jgi:DNA primase
MPDGLDPDELVSRDKDEWARLIENAKPVVTHVMETLAAGQDLNDAKTKSQIAAQVLPLIEDLPNALERDTYRQALARMLRVDERALIGGQAQGPGVRRARPGKREPVQESAPVAAATTLNAKEKFCLGVLFRRPELLYRLDRQLQESGLSSLTSDDFVYTPHKELVRIIRQSLEQVETDQHQFVIINLPEELKDVAQEQLALTEKLDPVQERILDELQRLIQKMRRTYVDRDFTELFYLQKEAQQNGDPLASMYQQQVRRLRDLRFLIDRADGQLNSNRQT